MNPAHALSSARRRRGKLIALLGGAALAAMALMAYLIWSGYREAMHGAETTSRNYAAIIEAHLDATLRRADAILQERARTTPMAALDRQAVLRYAREIDPVLESYLTNFPELASLRIFDAGGELLYSSSRVSATQANISDRSHFQRLRDAPQSNLLFSRIVVSRFTGEPTMFVGKAIRDPDGRFRGAVFAGVDLGYFQKLFQSLDVGAHGVIAIRRSDDFTPVVRWPPLDRKIDEAVPVGTPIRDAISAGETAATIEFPAVTDGTVRIFSFRKLARYPFFALTALAREDVLAGWKVRSLTVGAAGLLLLLLLGSLLFRLRHTQGTLDANEELMRSTFEQAAVGIAHIAPDTYRILRANHRFCELLGYTPDELVGTDSRTRTPPDEMPAREAERAELVKGRKRISSSERRLIRKDGSSLWVHRSLSLVRDAYGRPEYFISVIEDISARRQMEAALRASEARFRGIYENIQDVYFESTLEGILTEISPRVRMLSGNPAGPEEYVGRPAPGFYEDAERREEFVAALKERGSVADFEINARGIDGALIPCSLSATLLYDADRRPLRIVGTIRNISDRKRADVALRLGEANLRGVAENATVGITIFQDGQRVFANRRAAEMLGYSIEEFLPLAVSDIMHPDSRDFALDRALRRAAGEDIPARYEFTALTKDGRALPVEGNYAPIVWNGRPAFIVFAVDITERKRAEEQIQKQEHLLSQSQRIARIGSWSFDLASRSLAWTNETYRLYGVSPDTFTPLVETLIGLIHADDRSAMQKWIGAAAAGENPGALEFRVPMPDGSTRVLHGQGELIRDHRNQPAQLIGTAQDITERKLAENALRASEQRYERVVRHMSDALIVDDVEGRLLYANQRFFELFGIAPCDLRSIAIEDYVAPEWIAPLRDRHRRRMQGEDVPERFQYQSAKPDGSRLWLDVTVTKVLEGGQVVGTQSTIRDISGSKQMEDALRLLSTGMVHVSGEAFFTELAAQVAECVEVEIGFISRVQGPENARIRTLGLCVDRHVVPPLEYDLAGTPCDAVIGKQPVFFPDGVQQLFPAFRAAADLGVSGYGAVPLFDSRGTSIGAVGVMSRAPLHHPERVEALLWLFAVRAAAEIERQDTETKFRELFEFSPDAILMVNQEGRIAFTNRKAQILFGYSHEEFLDLAVDELVPAAARQNHAEMRRRFLSGPMARSMDSRNPELQAQRKDGTVFPVDISLNPLHTADGMLVATTVRDVSDRRRDEAERLELENRLRQSQKMEAIGTLAGGIAHDFNNILAAISGNAELARQDIDAQHPALASLDEIRKAGRRAKELIDQILAFSRQRQPSRQPMALAPVLDEAARFLRATLPAGVELAITLDEAAPIVLGDATQIHQIVLNLGTNAWHALEDKPGRIDIRLDGIAIDAGTASPGLPAGRYARVSVRDTGCGMDAAMLERVFEPFFTTKPVGTGTGLGLSVVHGIMQTHQGVVRVESAPGHGTTVDLYFPAIDAPASADVPGLAIPAPARGRGQRVLYLDDEDALVLLVTRMLERLNYRVSGYTEADAALEAVRSDPGSFDLVVTDYNMPGMSGIEVAQALVRIAPDLPVVITSGYISDQLRQDAALTGVRELIYKPNTVEDLCEAVQRLLD